MTAAPKLVGFAGALALLFGGGALAGGLTNATPPSGAATKTAKRGSAAMSAMRGSTGDARGSMSMGVRGLSVAENGLRLVVDRAHFERGRTQQLSFRVLDTSGKAVRKFDVEHTKRMHLIVVRRDMTGFQHLHPVERSDGTWSVPVRLRDAGSYRVFADFSHDGKATTLASDLTVDGSFTSTPLPAPRLAAAAGGGYQVELTRTRARAGREATLHFVVTVDGRPVAVQPYLGANGHLVALREDDLAFLHVHPLEEPASATADRGITFDADFPTSGRYRLFLQFKADGRVHTAAFTQEVI